MGLFIVYVFVITNGPGPVREHTNTVGLCISDVPWLGIAVKGATYCAVISYARGHSFSRASLDQIESLNVIVRITFCEHRS